MIASRLKGLHKVPLAVSPHTHYLSLAIPSLDCDEIYASRFDVDALARNEFFLINERHKVDLSSWNVPEASHLWNFNLHYFEFCIPLAARYASGGDREDVDHFKRLVLTWIATCKYPLGDAWHPYTISLRLVNWLICIDLFGDALAEDSIFLETVYESMYHQYRHLLANQEKHLLANHYFENLKTLLICALLFDEDDIRSIVQRDYLKQLDDQILPDGVHYERSMMYHKLILEGLLRVELAYRSIGESAPTKVATKVKQMLDAMASIERGMGKTPFFNDAADGVAKECTALTLACRDVYGYEPDDTNTSFSDSGFYKLYDGNVALIIFAGEPGPPYMLGHAHCDLLSFELSIEGKPVIVNSGTYAYQSDLRGYFRSTAAHNTAIVNDEEQLEFWAEHRVARGVGHVRVEVADERRIVASFRNFKGHLHRRRIELCDGLLTIEDLTDLCDVGVVQRYHLVPGCSLQIIPGQDCDFVFDEAACSSEFGELVDFPVAAVCGNGAAYATISLCNDKDGACR
ncbi:MAG: alginate lyase family protein [Collinsella sp.]|nr:alginate lyase family protein [Collinsella sp.]